MTACTDQIAVVTGASSGVGKAIALGLAAQGVTLCLMGRHRDTLEAVAARARGAAQRVLCYQTDLALDDDIQKATECLKRSLGGIDILVHSAGVISLGELEVTPVEDLDWHYRVNVRPLHTDASPPPHAQTAPRSNSVRKLECRTQC